MIDLEESSLADIVSNVLAVLMLVTVMALLGVGSGIASRTRGADHGGADAELSFLEPTRSPLPAFTRHYIVTAQGLTVLNSERIADMLSDATGPYAGEVRALEESDAVVAFELDRIWGPGAASYLTRLEKDLAQFSVKLVLPKEPISPTLAWDAPDAIAARIIDRMRKERRGPTFHVTRSGFDRFAGLYDALARRGVCFRWQSLADDMTITEYRDQDMFAAFQFRRCTLVP